LRSRLVTWKEPVVDEAQIAAMSGLDYLQHLLDSRRNPPIAALLDFKLVRIEPGRAVFSGTPSEFHYNPIGAVHDRCRQLCRPGHKLYAHASTTCFIFPMDR
jgi:hypothetical protein